LNAGISLNQVTMKSKSQTGHAISILDSQLGDAHTIDSLCADPGVIGLYTPFTFPSGSMSDSVCLIHLRPRASGYITVGLVYGPHEDINPLLNLKESILCIAHLLMALLSVWEEFSIG
jgi:hypothetical protein